MFDIASSELLLIAVVAVLVIGPKDLPRALYKFGQVVGKARGMARHFRTGIDAMVREAELEELQKQWAKQNEKIMEESRKAEASHVEPALHEDSPSLVDPSLIVDNHGEPAESSDTIEPAARPTGEAEESGQSSLPLDGPDAGQRTA